MRDGKEQKRHLLIWDGVQLCLQKQILLLKAYEISPRNTSITSALPPNLKEEAVILEMQKYVEEMLKNYNSMKQEIEALQYELNNFSTESENETIEAMIFSSPDGERVNSSMISNKTPEIALTYTQRNEELKENTMREIIGRMRWLRATTDRLDFYMEKLEAHQASILQAYYFEGYTWQELQDLRGVTEKTLRKYRDDGVKALAQKYSSLHRLGLL